MADEYVSALVRELHIRAAEIDFDCVITIYIGGGTPSVLTLAQMHKLMQGLREKVNFANVSEVTIEVNPDDVTEDYISGLKALGVNRVSMGVQSFVDAELKAVNRRHNAAEAITAVEAIRRAGIANVSIDLIYGLPGQTLQDWQETLANVLRMNPEHFSCYGLKIEENTPFAYNRSIAESIPSDEIQYKIQDEVVEIKEVNDKESIGNFGVTQDNIEEENEILEESEQISGGKVFNYPEEILKEKEEAGKTIIEENKNELESHERPKEVKVNASKDIFKVFTINDKFLYRRELFGNSDAQYKEALELISRMDSFEDVKDYFLNDLGWNPNDENAKGFMETLEKKYFN